MPRDTCLLLFEENSPGLPELASWNRWRRKERLCRWAAEGRESLTGETRGRRANLDNLVTRDSMWRRRTASGSWRLVIMTMTWTRADASPKAIAGGGWPPTLCSMIDGG
jgi:hypothetical protein